MAKNITSIFLRQGLFKNQPVSVLLKRFTKNVSNEGDNTSASTPDAPGLSCAVHTNDEPVGPGASKSKEYKVPEYFNFNRTSYFQAEIEIAKYRCPQPSAIQKSSM